jgi:hypothetical protein
LLQEAIIQQNTPSLDTVYKGVEELYQNKLQGGDDARQSHPRNNAARRYAKALDGDECAITWRGLERTPFDVQACHILPRAFTCNRKSRENEFWQALDVLWGTEQTDIAWECFGYTKVDRPANIITYCSDIHQSVDSGYSSVRP